MASIMAFRKLSSPMIPADILERRSCSSRSVQVQT